MSIKSWIRKVFLKKKPVARPKFKPIFLDGKIVDMQIEDLRGMSNAEKDFFISSLQLALLAINSDHFKKRLISSNGLLRHTRGMSTIEIYDLLMSGKTLIEGSVDGVMNVTYNLYKTWRNTVGYVTVGDSNDDINFNEKFLRLDDNGKAVVGGNFAHENCHNVGFSDGPTGYDYWSVPYFVGRIVSELITNHLSGKINLHDDLY